MLSLLVGGCATIPRVPLPPIELTEMTVETLAAPSPAAQRDARHEEEAFGLRMLWALPIPLLIFLWIAWDRRQRRLHHICTKPKCPCRGL